jgi:UDP-N-acetylglucosamine 1-carboxyvinyltransferase
LSCLVIQGGRHLTGRVRVSGRKNAAVAVLPAALLCEDENRFEDLPDIRDVRTFSEIMQAMGADIERDPQGLLRVRANGLSPSSVPQDLSKRLRASYYLLGVLLARFGYAEVPLPGGCSIGLRPIDQHIKGLRALGAEVELEHGVIKARARKLRGASIYLDVVSVGATINILLAATRAEGTTIIENAAKEPHVVDLATFLNTMGADVRGAGTDVIKVRGVEELHGCSHAIIPDEIEAATLMLAAAATGGDVVVENVIPKHLDPVSAKLREAGVHVEENGDWIRVKATGRPKAVNVKTLPYPGFPTDAQQPISALLAIADGTSFITETIWERRFKHVGELNRMGADIRVEGHTAIINGVPDLSGTEVRATDLRAGAALIIAGLMAKGETKVCDMEHVDRGYERIDEKLSALGACICRSEP